MHKVKLTSKRQATFPAQVCRSLGVKPGDELILEPLKQADGSQQWLLKPVRQRERPWLASLRSHVSKHAHDMETIRESIARKRAKGG